MNHTRENFVSLRINNIWIIVFEGLSLRKYFIFQFQWGRGVLILCLRTLAHPSEGTQQNDISNMYMDYFRKELLDAWYKFFAQQTHLNNVILSSECSRRI